MEHLIAPPLAIVSQIVVGLIMAVVSIAVSELLKSKPKIENARPASDGDFAFPTSIEDRVIPVVFGTVRLAGPNVMWWGDRSQRPIKETIKINLWSQKRVITGWEYDVGIQFGLCRGPIDGSGEGVKRIWVGDDEVWSGAVSDGTIDIDEPELFGGEDFGNGGVSGTVRIHPGTETQGVNAYLTAHQDPQPAYRGTVYAVLEKGYIGNSPQAVAPWSFEVSRYPNGLGLTSGREIVNGADANPAAVLYELLTNDEWGFGYTAADIDVDDFKTAGNTLHAEGNGFSFQMESEIAADEFQLEVERQIGGVVYLDQQSGKYKINLARGGYDVGSLPAIDETNTISIQNFSRGAWDETTNQVRVRFSSRDRLYKKTHAKGDDLGNVRIQGGEVVSDSITYPGVKNKALANALASRDIRERSVPLAKANVTVDRSMWQLVLGDVVVWSSPTLGLEDVPMRVIRINRGTLLDSQIELTLLQDVFEWDAGIFGDPPDTLWAAPSDDVSPILAAESAVVEAPRAVVKRDPLAPDSFNRLWAYARSPGGPEVTFKIFQRNHPTTPSGAFFEAGEVYGFMKIGELGTALSPADAMPTVTVRLDATPDAIENLLEEFTTLTDLDVGDLAQVIAIGDEFLGVESVVDQTTWIDLKNVWRGLMDTVPDYHDVDDDVFLVFVSAGLSDSPLPENNVVDVQLRSRSRTDQATEGESATVQLTMADRARRPYPPTELTLNGSRYDSTVDFDELSTGGSTLDERGVEAGYVRRDLDTFNEVIGIGNDAEDLDPSFPAKHSTEYRHQLFERTDLASAFNAFWNLDEESGTRFADIGTVDLTDNNTVGFVAGHSANVGNAADFEASQNESLSASDDPSVSFGNESFEIAGFAYLESTAGTHGVINKWSRFSGVDIEYGVWISGSAFRFAMSGDGTLGAAYTQINHSLTLSSGTWYWFRASYDDVNDLMTLEVVPVSLPRTQSTIDTAAHSAGCNDSTNDLRLGVIEGSVSDQFLDGRLNAIGIAGRLLTEAERDNHFNQGNGNEVPFAATTLGDSGFNSGEATAFVSRTEILRSIGGRLPDDLRTEITARHTIDGDVLEARADLAFDYARAAGTLDDDTNLSVLDTDVVSNEYTAPDTGTYNFEIGTALPNGDVEARINGGSWVQVIAATNTTGTLAGVTAADTIEVRHRESVATAETFLQIDAPTSFAGAYGILIN